VLLPGVPAGRATHSIEGQLMTWRRVAIIGATVAVEVVTTKIRRDWLAEDIRKEVGRQLADQVHEKAQGEWEAFQRDLAEADVARRKGTKS
jgi:hypothetical protein